MSEKKQTILLVDDEPDIVESLFDTFVDEYNICKASNAEDALEIVKNNPVDLVICDQSMPEMTGLEFFEEIKENHAHIGKILLTGYSDNQVVVDSMKSGNVDKCVTKPWEDEEIQRIVSEVLNSKL